MKCLTKIPHRVLTYSFVAFLCSLFVSLFGISQDSFATSVSCQPSFTYNSSYLVSLISDFCNTSSLDSSVRWYYYGDFVYTGSAHPLMFSNNLNGGNSNSPYSSYASGILTSATWGNSFYFIITDQKTYRFRSISIDNDNNSFSSFNLTISDSFGSSCPECEVCQTCPEIPENPYDNKLDDIKKAIYCCGAVLIMLYFFFCIYKIIVKDGGSR